MEIVYYTGAFASKLRYRLNACFITKALDSIPYGDPDYLRKYHILAGMEDYLRPKKGLDLLLAVERSELIGACTLHYRKKDTVDYIGGEKALVDCLWLASLGSLRKGIGTTLMSAAAKLAKDKGLALHLNSSDTSIKFYQKLNGELLAPYKFCWRGERLKRLANLQNERIFTNKQLDILKLSGLPDNIIARSTGQELML